MTDPWSADFDDLRVFSLAMQNKLELSVCLSTTFTLLVEVTLLMEPVFIYSFNKFQKLTVPLYGLGLKLVLYHVISEIYTLPNIM